MTHAEFEILIDRVSFIAFTFTKNFLSNRLVSEFRYDVYLNASYDDHSVGAYDYYPEDDRSMKQGLTDLQVCALLYRKGKVPVWIDISVSKADRTATTFKLLCSGRYSDDEEEYYYQSRGTGPFGIKICSSLTCETRHRF